LHILPYYRDELKSRYGLGSPEMQAAVQEEVKRAEREHQASMKHQQEKYVDPLHVFESTCI